MAGDAVQDDARLHAAAGDSCGDGGSESDGSRAQDSRQASSGPGPGLEGAASEATDGTDGQQDAGQSADADAAGVLSAPADASSPPAAPREPTEEELAQIEVAEALKAEGNAAYKEGQYEAATSKYWEAVDAAPECATRQRAVYYANVAACELQLHQPQQAAEHCSTALAHDPQYVKALMRRSTALQELDDLEHALADARKVCELDPGSAWGRGAVASLEPRVKERQEKLQAEMLGKLKDLGNSLLGKFGLSLDNFKAEKDPATGGYSIKFQQ